MTYGWHFGHSSWSCKKYNKSFSLRSGTVMQYSNLPFSIWLRAMHLLTITKKSISGGGCWSPYFGIKWSTASGFPNYLPDLKISY